jgi:hypothetical protein
LPRTGEHDHPDVRIRVAAIEGGFQFQGGLEIDRVAYRRPIDRDGRDEVVNLYQDTLSADTDDS